MEEAEGWHVTGSRSSYAERRDVRKGGMSSAPGAHMLRKAM
jgi:hypothetical protein